MNKEELKKRVDKIIEGISSDANTYIKYWGEDDSRFIYEIAIKITTLLEIAMNRNGYCSLEVLQ